VNLRKDHYRLRDGPADPPRALRRVRTTSARARGPSCAPTESDPAAARRPSCVRPSYADRAARPAVRARRDPRPRVVRKMVFFRAFSKTSKI
jgi:hypothetical protein